jgi:hypothetical protein
MDLGLEGTAITSHDGYWHPAVIRLFHGEYAWYNVKMSTKEEAEKFAREAIGDAKQAALQVINAWNIQKVS